MVKKENKEGQASVELLMLLAIALVVLLVMVFVSQEQTVDIINQKEQTDAKNSVNDLGAASKEVYTQGEGARKQVYIILPSGYEPTESYVENNTVNIHVSGTDYNVNLDFEVHGSLPGSSGAHWVWVISEGNSVRIGSAMLSLDKSTIYVIMNRNDSESDSFTVTSLWNENITVTLSQEWIHGEVSLDSSPNSFVLEPDGERLISLDFSTTEDAVGLYHGEIEITGEEGNNSETVTLPITVDVVGYGTGIAPPLTITPSIWNQTVMPDTNSTKEFMVCTNSETSLTSVTFETTSGTPGIWVSNLNALPAMNPDTCLPKVFSLYVPNGTISALYTGSLIATGEGVDNAEDSVALFITVGGDLTDNEGPLVTNIEHIPQQPFLGDPVTISATCDDSTRGNSTVKKGEIRVDEGDWTTMLPSDGTYDTSVEGVAYTIYDLGFGPHNVTIRCTDYHDNVGPEELHEFNMMKEFLFITKDIGSSGSEQNWIDWINTHSSNESYVWNIDRVHRNDVVDASFDMERYAIAILAEDKITSGSTGVQLVTKLIGYMSSGGQVLLLDEALEDPAQDLGICDNSNDHTEPDIYVIDNTHYITSNLPSEEYYDVYTVKSKIYYLRDGYADQVLTTDYGTGGHRVHANIGYGNGFVAWGASLPYRFNIDGNDLTTRVFDYAIMQSTIGE